MKRDIADIAARTLAQLFFMTFVCDVIQLITFWFVRVGNHQKLYTVSLERKRYEYHSGH